MRLILRTETSLGPRTTVTEIADSVTAEAIRSAHLAAGGGAALIESATPINMAQFIAAQHKRQNRAKLRLVRI